MTKNQRGLWRAIKNDPQVAAVRRRKADVLRGLRRYRRIFGKDLDQLDMVSAVFDRALDYVGQAAYRRLLDKEDAAKRTRH
jgi:hypothetical protein